MDDERKASLQQVIREYRENERQDIKENQEQKKWNRHESSDEIGGERQEWTR